MEGGGVLASAQSQAIDQSSSDNGHLCHNLYLQSKQPNSYKQIEAALIEQTSKGKRASSAKLVEALRDLSFYQPDDQLLDVLLNALTQHDDRKLAGLVYYFLSTTPRQLRSDGLTNQLVEVLMKEAKSPLVARRIMALRTLATLTPLDNKTVDDFLGDTIFNILMKEDDSDREKANARRTFRRHKTETSDIDRPLDQAGALLTAGYRLGKNKNMVQVAIRGMFCEDPTGARHAISLLLQLAEAYPVEVAEGVKNFLPQNAARTPRPVITAVTYPSDRPNISDAFGRAQFVRLCGYLAMSSELSKDLSEAYFQALCQSVVDMNERVAFMAIEALCAFPWGRISAARVLPVVDEYCFTPKDKLPLTQVIVTRIVQVLTDPTRSAVALHAACRTARLFARSRVINFGDYVRDTHRVLDVLCRPLLALLPQPNNNTTTTSIETGRIYVEVEALKALLWLTFPNHNTRVFANAFGNQIRANIFSASQFTDLFKELHERLQASPDMIHFAVKLIQIWYSNVPEKTNVDSITAIWATILKLDEEFDARGRRHDEEEEQARTNGDGEDEYEDYRYTDGDQPRKPKALRERLLKHVFKMLDCQHKASQRTPDVRTLRSVIWRLRTRFLHFLAVNAHTLSGWNGESNVDECPALKAILLRLETAIVSESWETRIVASEDVANLAFRFPALRTQAAHLFGKPSNPSSAASKSPAVPWVTSPTTHLIDIANAASDRGGVSFLSLPLEERRKAAELSAKVKEQMSLFGPLPND